MPLPAALLPALLLGLLWPGAVRGRSPPSRLPAGPRQRRWDAALFARSVARLPAEPWGMGQHVECEAGVLQPLVEANGVSVALTPPTPSGHSPCPPDFSVSSTGLLEISPVERGVVSIFGVRSGLFVAMNSKGKLYGSTHFNDECKFKEILLPNNYNAYESRIYPGMYIALSKNGRTKKGNKVSPTMTVTHFLPRI
ncbi:FGF4 factor, partial [Rhinopomastus cyanomelas]|nr:FGF4 factor [Rhinopomastus cyanomelas]